jgi:hypothetical protein
MTIRTYEIHPFASIVRMPAPQEQETLKLSIERSGGLEVPIVLWKGKIVDGRCRQMACVALNMEIPENRIDHLSESLTPDEVKDKVRALNTRRNLSVESQLASFYKEQVASGKSNAAMVADYGCSGRALTRLHKIVKLEPKYLDYFFEEKVIEVYDMEKEVMVKSKKVYTILSVLERNLKFVPKESSEVVYAKDYLGQLSSLAGEELFCDTTRGKSVSIANYFELLVDKINNDESRDLLLSNTKARLDKAIKQAR